MLYRRKGHRSTCRVLHENVTMHCKLSQMDDEPMVVYQSVDDGAVHVRPVAEFYDGRFEHLPEPKKTNPKADPLREALAIARKRIEYLGSFGNERHQKANEDQFFPMIDAALAAQPSAAPVAGRDRHAVDSAALSAAREVLGIALAKLPLVQRKARIQCIIADAIILAVTPGERATAWHPGKSIETRARDLLEVEMNATPAEPTIAALRAIESAVKSEVEVINVLRAVFDDWTITYDESGMEEYQIKDVAPETVELVNSALRGRLYAPSTPPVVAGADRAAVIEECAKVADNFASFEETAIERVYADPALSESVRKDINHSAGSRQVAAEQIAHDIRALDAGKVGEGK